MRKAGTLVWSLGLLSVLLLASRPAGAGEEAPKFTSRPAAKKVGGQARIQFAVSAATDVEVAVLNAKGEVVRHLAAGLLGEKAPAPLKKDALAQEVAWDGKDDRGKPAAGGPFKVRVRLGMKPKLEKLIGDNPSAVGGVRGLVVGPKGELFVFHVYGAIHPGDGTGFCTVFSRDGKYLRTILPYPADLPDEKLKGLKRVTLAGGRTVPYIFQGETRSMLPGVGDLPVHRPVVSSDGRVAFVGHQEWCKSKLRYNRPGPNQVTVIRSDGSIPKPPLRAMLDDFSAAGGGNLALSPDEKTLYATRVISGYKGRHHAVYKFGWDEEKPTAFIGDPKAAGSGKDKLNLPSSVAVDSAGNIYVADSGNNRVAVFKPDASYLGELKVPAPDQVCVHPKTGAIYLTAGDKGRKLLKFASWKAPEPVAEAKLPFYSRDTVSMLALDGTAEKPVLWYSGPRSWYAGRFAVLRIEDLGEKFGDQQKLSTLQPRGEPCAGPILGLALQRSTKRLLVNSRLYDLKAGAWSRGLRANHGTKGGVGWFGLDNSFYSLHYARNLARRGPDLKARPFGDKKELIGPEGGTTHLRGRGVTADADGNIYVIWQEKGASHYVALYDSAGKALKRIVDCKIRGIQSVRLDHKGNIYLAVCVRPEGVKAPKELAAKKLGTSWHSKMPSIDINWYELLYGCIVKFGPEGGKISGEDGVAMEYGIQDKRKRHTKIKGAKWIYFGASPFVSWRQPFPDSCICEGATFDVDGYGRCWFPDAGRFQVGVLDTGGNEILRFGDYGNADSAGAKSKVPKPEIPLLWPYMIEADDGVIYVGDRLNRRVLVIRLDHAAEAVCAAP